MFKNTYVPKKNYKHIITQKTILENLQMEAFKRSKSKQIPSSSRNLQKENQNQRGHKIVDRKWCEQGEAGCGSGRGGGRISRRGVTLRGRRHYARPTARHRRPPAPRSPRKNDASSAPLLRLHKFTRPECSACAQCVSAPTNTAFSLADASIVPDLGILRYWTGRSNTVIIK